MNEFKQVPFIKRLDPDSYNYTGDRKDIHYTVEVRWAVIGDIKQDEDGKWELVEDGYNIERTNPIHSIGQNSIDWSKIKTIHFDKSCTVPRFKLGNFCTKNNIKVIRDANKADLIIYGKNFTKNILRSSYDNIMYRTEFLKRAKKSRWQRNLPEDIIPVVEKCESEYVILNEEYEEFTRNAKVVIGDSYCHIEDYPRYQQILDPNTKYASQDKILKNMGLDPMDEHTFRRLCDMFDSKDKGNHVVGMEIMANCDYESSIVYLLELMRRYYHNAIYFVPERNNVSFKALREYLDYEPKHDCRSLNNIIENVAERNLLIESNYKLILSLILEEESNEMGKNENDEEDNDNWRVLQVDLSPKYKAMVIPDKILQPNLTV